MINFFFFVGRGGVVTVPFFPSPFLIIIWKAKGERKKKLDNLILEKLYTFEY